MVIIVISQSKMSSGPPANYVLGTEKKEEEKNKNRWASILSQFLLRNLNGNSILYFHLPLIGQNFVTWLHLGTTEARKYRVFFS